MKKRIQAGFTLVEIVVVIAIIGIMASMFIGPSLLKSRTRARDTVRKRDLTQIANSLEMYVNDYNQYPGNGTGGEIGACGGSCAWGGEFNDGTTVYMKKLPGDPISGQHYVYYSDGVGWQLFTFLEASDDPVLDRDGDGDYDSDDDFAQVYADCGGGACNYGISSSNIGVDDVL